MKISVSPRICTGPKAGFWRYRPQKNKENKEELMDAEYHYLPLKEPPSKPETNSCK
jgi:hypothetical protein